MSSEPAPQAPELDAPSRAIVDHLERHPFLDPVNMQPPEMRAAFDAFYATIDLPPEPVAVTDRSFPGPAGDVGVRIYHPREDAPGLLPVTLLFKGGGLVMGSLDSYDAICRRLCAASGSIVVSVDYRQPPEHKFPAALDDCYAALRWVRREAGSFGGDGVRVAVSGDSGGGMLAVAVTHLAHDAEDPALDYQFLVYPAVGSDGPTPSMKEFSRGYVFQPEQLDWLYAQYLADPADRVDPLVSPGLRRDLAGLPPAFVVTAHFDIFRDEGEDYARRLAEAGVPVEVKRYDTVIHGFLNMGGRIPAAGDALDEAGERLRRAFADAASRTAATVSA